MAPRGEDGRWGREGTTAQRASSLDNRWRRGRASGSMAGVVVAEKSKLKIIPNS